MIIVDKKLAELEKKGKPIRVGLVGAGYAARGFALQLLTRPIGMRLVAVANRTLQRAKQLYVDLGMKAPRIITDNPMILCQNPDIDVIVEATGSFEYASRVVLSAIQHKKHVVLINAELDATVGPILKVKADRNGVVYTQADGDQPGVLMNLYREVTAMGLQPVLAGNVKGLLDYYRNPETQVKYAKDHGINPQIAASFADGTKISQEMATVANAMNFRVLRRGMIGPKAEVFEESTGLFSHKELLGQGVVDYLLGVRPAYGVFIIGCTDNRERKKYLKEYKMGEGPLYVFTRPYHLSPLEAPSSVARAAIFHDATIAPVTHACDVIAVAKKNLSKDETLDGSGGFTCYGTIENVPLAARENLLPLGISEGCQLIRDVAKDTVLRFSDVTVPAGRLIDRLWREQTMYFTKTA